MTKLSYQIIDRKTKETILETADYSQAKQKYAELGSARAELVKVLTPVPNFYKKDETNA